MDITDHGVVLARSDRVACQQHNLLVHMFRPHLHSCCTGRTILPELGTIGLCFVPGLFQAAQWKIGTIPEEVQRSADSHLIAQLTNSPLNFSHSLLHQHPQAALDNPSPTRSGKSNNLLSRSIHQCTSPKESSMPPPPLTLTPIR
jgi:hypothetical protein